MTAMTDREEKLLAFAEDIRITVQANHALRCERDAAQGAQWHLEEEIERLKRELDAMAKALDEARALLREWRALPSEPTPGDGLVSTNEDIAEHDAWNAAFADLAKRTDLAVGQVVCSTCNDTHGMELNGAIVMCTRCPLPCEKCRQRPGGNSGPGAFCATTPCACECHKPKAGT